MKYFLALILIFSSAKADYPAKVDKYVNDFAGVIDDKVEVEINEKLKAFDTQTTNEIVIATFPELKGNLEEVSNKLFRDWGIGKKETNNGVAFFIFLKDENGKGKTRIEVGKGLEGVIPDSKSKLLYEREIKPFLVKRDFTGGVNVAADKLMAYAKEELTGPPAPAEVSEGPSVIFNVFILFAFLSVIALVLWRLLNGNEPDDCTNSTGPAAYTPRSTPYRPANPTPNSNMYSNYNTERKVDKPKSTPKKKSRESSRSRDQTYTDYSSGYSTGSSSSYDSGSSSSSYDSGGGSSDGGGSSGDF